VSSVFRTVKYIHYTLHYVTTCTVVIDYTSRETTVRYYSWDATAQILTSHSCEYSYGLWAGRPGFNSHERQKLFSLLHVAQTDQGSTQAPTQWVPVTLSPEASWLEREADHSPPSSADANSGGAAWLSASLDKERDNLADLCSGNRYCFWDSPLLRVGSV
jgi:hypothetical protein